MTEEDLHRTLELEDDFNIHGNSSKIFRLKLCSTCLTIEQVSSNNRSTISIDDLYGCLAMKSKENAIKCYLVLYLYVFKATNALSTTSPRRGSFHRREKVFTYRKFNDFAQNLAEMTRWTRLLKTFSFLRRQLPGKLRHLLCNWLSFNFTYVLLVEIRSKNSEKPALVLVNPAGGAGKAQRLILEHAAGIWSQAEFSHQVILTGKKTNVNESNRFQKRTILFKRIFRPCTSIRTNGKSIRLEWHRRRLRWRTRIRSKIERK